MSISKFAVSLLVLLSLAVGNARGVSYYTVTDLGAFYARGINNSGQVVGYTYNSDDNRQAFIDDFGTVTDLGALDGLSTIARGINDSGQVVGTSVVDDAYRAYIYDNGTMTNLGTLPGDYLSFGRAINNSGQVAGSSHDYSYKARAFLYDNGAMTDLGILPGYEQSRARGINNSGQVAGFSYNFDENAHAFLYDNGAMTDLGTLGGASSVARGINDSGQVVGYAYNADNLRRAFLYDNGAMTDLGSLGGWKSIARDINASSQVVGTSETARAGEYHAFVYENGTMTDLKSRIDPASHWSFRNAAAINDSGMIVGVGQNPSGAGRGFLLTPITRTDAGLSLLATHTNLRMMQNSGTATGGSSIAIDAAGNTTTDYTLASSELTVAADSGTLAPAAVTSVPFSMRWNDTSTTGTKTGSVALANVDDPADSGNHVMDVTGAVLANRVMNVAPVGTAATPKRVMAKAETITAINTGSDPVVDGDDAATRVNAVPYAKIRSGNATVTYSSTQPGGTMQLQFNGPDQSSNLAVKFKSTGRYTGSINVASVPLLNGRMSNGLVRDGEAASVGAEMQPTTLDYDVAVLKPRRLRVSTKRLNLGNVLRGASISENIMVNSRNLKPDADHATMVNVASGGTALGELTAGQTLVTDGSLVGVPLTGTLNTYGRVKFRGTMPVVTAEDVSVQDNTIYRDLNVRYKANVGIAKLGKLAAFGSGETSLLANVAAGSELTNLSSKVKPNGKLIENTTLATWVTGTNSFRASALYGAVGSEAEIVTSTPIAADTTVTMRWRKRTPGEAHNPRHLPSPSLPADAWLVSDVVQIDGIDIGVSYALQMTFDNRINLALDGPIDGTVANELPGLFLAQFDLGTDQWVNAVTLGAVGPNAQQGILTSLSDFLVANPTTPLIDLQGSWGVDPVTSAYGIGHSWAILAGGGSGIFAVDPSNAMPTTWLGNDLISTVPEPSTWAMLIAAAVSLLTYCLHRRQR